jgi:hypothetical protein
MFGKNGAILPSIGKSPLTHHGRNSLRPEISRGDAEAAEKGNIENH